MLITIPHHWKTDPVWTGEAESLDDAVGTANGITCAEYGDPCEMEAE